MGVTDFLYKVNKGFHGIESKIDPVSRHYDPALSSSQIVADALGKKNTPVPPGAPPNVSTAANLAQQQNDLRDRQRGVLANIYAGNNAPPPTTATGTVLGG